MSKEQNPFEIDFDTYILQSESSKQEKGKLWQIHPFGEGNTRTTAVFTIKYLNSLGFKVNNEPFEKNS